MGSRANTSAGTPRSPSIRSSSLASAYPDEAIVAGLRDVKWPGRFQQIGSRVVLDGAHNTAAARCLAQTWRETFGENRATLIFGALSDKDLAGMCGALLPIAERVITVPVRSARTSTAEDLRALCQKLAPEVTCNTAPDLATALQLAGEHPERALVTGSLFLIGEAVTQLQNQPLPLASAQ